MEKGNVYVVIWELVCFQFSMFPLFTSTNVLMFDLMKNGLYL